jgi:hypothetical protein|tara:strand:- start:322 stop:834 length:513 start_codon:yes stop_codon:yes gene_type:complete
VQAEEHAPGDPATFGRTRRPLQAERGRRGDGKRHLRFGVHGGRDTNAWARRALMRYPSKKKMSELTRRTSPEMMMMTKIFAKQKRGKKRKESSCVLDVLLQTCFSVRRHTCVFSRVCVGRHCGTRVAALAVTRSDFYRLRRARLVFVFIYSCTFKSAKKEKETGVSERSA